MQFSQKTIRGLFSSNNIQFIIPVYQRAYSWDLEEWKIFFEDLKEQTFGNNNYFLGNVLIETIKKDSEYEIIDGQQRLTTIIIFIRSIVDILKKRIKQKEDVNIDIDDLEINYFKYKGRIKLRPVDYDRACFDSLIVDGNSSYSSNTPSQKRIKKAKDYFYKELDKIDTKSILTILEKLQSSDITTIELSGKKDSALMFELQNNRGKTLTNMERLKSYFMYQMYVYSTLDEVDSNIEHVSNVFENIYLTINDLKELTEDSILIYHCYAYIKGFSYRTIEDIKEVFKKQKNKIDWIKIFIEELNTTFSNMKKLEKSKDKYLLNLRSLKIPAFVYPFLVKGYKYHNEDKLYLSNLFHIMEIIVFRYRLVNSRADIISRINEILVNYDGNLETLKKNFKTKFNDAWYWGDRKIKEVLNGYMYENSVLHYLLWKYEDFIQNAGYHLGNCKIDNESIEHISPKTPTNGILIASGYEVDKNNKYDEDFIISYLNCIGNLMLISGSHNSSIGNKPFKDKLNSYNKNPLLNQQAEIKVFIDDKLQNPKWDRKAIDKRHEKIVNFALNNWSFDSIQY